MNKITKIWCILSIFLGLKIDLSWAIAIPSSARSSAVIAATEPNLQQQFLQKKLVYGSPIFIRVFKESKILEVWVKKNQNFSLFKQYPICDYGRMGLGPKHREGDGFAPEGFYKIYPKSLNPNSTFHLSFNLGYPNDYDRAYQRTGSALMIHGNCVSIGCYAMTDAGIEEIYTLVHAALHHGQPFIQVHLFPFELTQAKLNAYLKHKNIVFWNNLKIAYDFFEKNRQLPSIRVKDKRYIFR